jgi:hypothetical protein
LITLCRMRSYEDEVMVTGNPSGHGTGVVTNGFRPASS